MGGTASGALAANLHVVVADDDDDSRLLMSSAFRRAGFQVHETSNGNELVASFASLATKRVVVVSDIGMPECDGIAATIALRKLQPDALVLLVTAFVGPTTMADARKAGAAEVLHKPVNFEHLVKTAIALLTRE